MDIRDKIENYRTRCLAEVHAKNEDELEEAMDARVETGFEILNAYLDLKQALQVMTMRNRAIVEKYCDTHDIFYHYGMTLEELHRHIAGHAIERAEQAQGEGEGD